MVKKKVLIVDDDPQVRKILERMLGEDYEIFSVEEGNRALDCIAQSPPDLVILDIMMPGISGIEVCRRIREEHPERDIHVLMLSAKDSQSDRRRALEYGADDYVTKPFHIDSLVRKIDYIFEKRR